jgi:hypothetical protein
VCCGAAADFCSFLQFSDHTFVKSRSMWPSVSQVRTISVDEDEENPQQGGRLVDGRKAEEEDEYKEEQEVAAPTDYVEDFRFFKGLDMRGRGAELNGTAVEEFLESVRWSAADEEREIVEDLVFLDFKEGCIGREGESIHSLVRLMAMNAQTLQCLDFRGNRLCAKCPNPGLELASGLLKVEMLHSLDLSQCDIMGESRMRYRALREISSSLGRLRRLRRLRMRGNFLHCEGIKIVASGLRDFKGLIELDVSDNPMTSCPGSERPSLAGIMDLSTALRESTKLKILQMNKCGLRDEGTKLICNAASMHSALEHLDLGKNQITSVGAGHIGGVIRSSGSLQQVSIRHNMIGTEGAQLLASSFAAAPNIKTLDLGFNSIDSAAMRDLEMAALANIHARSMPLEGNGLPRNLILRVKGEGSALCPLPPARILILECTIQITPCLQRHATLIMRWAYCCSNQAVTNSRPR